MKLALWLFVKSGQKILMLSSSIAIQSLYDFGYFVFDLH